MASASRLRPLFISSADSLEKLARGQETVVEVVGVGTARRDKPQHEVIEKENFSRVVVSPVVRLSVRLGNARMERFVFGGQRSESGISKFTHRLSLKERVAKAEKSSAERPSSYRRRSLSVDWSVIIIELLSRGISAL
ncbi:hypothetical protein EYF80_033273 [Liparis tanakae]|uniref:Uncharacterized protein n=1 Tax=Liparis tanakae TaxID=230148 RepID=A0A4Z2GSI1_9TELE|nr:hypothetical protein EYF80_033273 [Liparis tanakae]